MQMRGMADKRVENASQAAGEAKNSSPEVRLGSDAPEMTCAKNKTRRTPRSSHPQAQLVNSSTRTEILGRSVRRSAGLSQRYVCFG